jgi:hypothetical protein
MEKLSLIDLYQIKSRLIKESMTEEPIWFEVLESIKEIEDRIIEDTSATGGPFVSGGGGMSGNPVDLGKTPLGPKWASGSTDDKGYIDVPYNPSGTNRMMQRIPVMGKDHGARTGKKSREKRLDIKALRAALAKRKDFERRDGEKKVMNFDNFAKDEFSRVKKESKENLVLENKITDFVKKYDITEIKRLLKEKLEIDENSTKKEVAKKLLNFYIKLNLRLLKYELGAILGGFIFYFLSIVLDVAGVKPFVTDGDPTTPHFILWGAGVLLGIIKAHKNK